MGTITVGQGISTPIEVHHEDHRGVPPVVMLADWPLDELPPELRARMPERAEATRPR